MFYEQLIKKLDGFESYKYTVRSEYQVLSCIVFEQDPVDIKTYIDIRLNDNDISTISLIKDLNISPSKYVILGNCSPTSISVERSFSMLKKLLAKDRNFNSNNISDYFCCYYNYKFDKNWSDDDEII